MRSIAPLLPLLPLLCAASTSPDPPKKLTDAAVYAVEKRSYCEALALFEASNERWPSPRALYNAAEVANAAGDRWRAVELYREAQRFYPEYERAEVMQKRLDALGRRIAREGPGAACPRLANRCGDWRLEGNETCDDGNTNDGSLKGGDTEDADTCDSNCTHTGCGNGVMTDDEKCDDGNLVSGDGCDNNCTVTACGNGVATPGEQCDDGNLVDGDGCDSTCTRTACGNGVRTGDEECDDGNERDGDGCDEGCLLTRCGNGVPTRGEQCDDGNTIDGDGCESSCMITRVAAPLPGILVGSAGLVSSAAAAGLFWAAGYQWLAHEQAVDAIDYAERTYADDQQESLRIVERARQQEDDSRIAWEGWGRAALGGGVLLSVGGVSAIIGGAWWALTRTEELDSEGESK